MIVEVAYALADKQSLISIKVEKGATLKEAVEASGILDTFEEIDLSKDRVEIYRPLIADPKKVRKERAAEGKAMRVNQKA